MIPMVGEARALAMVDDAPRALLEGRAPQLPPVEDEKPRGRGFLSRLFGKR